MNKLVAILAILAITALILALSKGGLAGGFAKTPGGSMERSR